MAIKAHLDQPTSGNHPRGTTRAAQRRALRLEASGFVRGASEQAGEANVTIHNISAAGLLLETGLDLAAGEQLALDLPEAGTVTTVVVWRSERLYGCAFAQALSPAALAAAQLQAAPPVAAAPRNHSSEALGARLNRLRREAGLTLADVATTLGVSKPTVWAWEKGKARPLPERLEAIAAALGVTPDMLSPDETGSGKPDAVIAECRERIAEACGTFPGSVRILIEL